jgi:quercetin dioxygenase-like cupin family protein
MAKRPYSETRSENNLRRVFKPNVDNSELVWHRDREDRLVEVVSGKGWMFQLDNEVPIELKAGDKFKIKKETYHRIIRGNTPLEVNIKLLN